MAKDLLTTLAIALAQIEAQIDRLQQRRAEIAADLARLDAAIAEVMVSRAQKTVDLKDEAKK